MFRRDRRRGKTNSYKKGRVSNSTMKSMLFCIELVFERRERIPLRKIDGNLRHKDKEFGES